MSGRRFESLRVKDAGFTPEQREQMRQVAQTFQDEKLTEAEMDASGKYSAPMPLGAFLDSLFAVAELKKTRETLGLSLTDVSERSGIDRATLCKIENGKGNPTIQTIGRYAAALGKRVTIVLEDLVPSESAKTNSPAIAS
jgi:DNA-binding XRE family transcriptional regulator